jgi:YggT family protein
MRIDQRNTITQVITRITQPPLAYIGKILPSAIPTHIRVFILLVVVELIKLLAISLLYALWPNIIGLFGWAAVDLLNRFATLYIYILFMHVLFSWLMPKHPSPISYMVYTLTYRLLTNIRRFVPTIKGFDLSPLIAILLIQVMISFIFNPLTNTLMQWTLS